MSERVAAPDRPQCCWTHCENVQGVGTWTEINGETLPVCEEHWFGNIDRERRELREQNELLRQALAQSIPAADVWHTIECRTAGCERCGGVRAGARPKVVI